MVERLGITWNKVQMSCIVHLYDLFDFLEYLEIYLIVSLLRIEIFERIAKIHFRHTMFCDITKKFVTVRMIKMAYDVFKHFNDFDV